MSVTNSAARSLIVATKISVFIIITIRKNIIIRIQAHSPGLKCLVCSLLGIVCRYVELFILFSSHFFAVTSNKK